MPIARVWSPSYINQTAFCRVLKVETRVNLNQINEKKQDDSEC